MLVGDAGDGELFHVWTGNAFNVYQLTAGQWRIYGRAALMLPGQGGSSGFPMLAN
jgi:hypothetical protein